MGVFFSLAEGKKTTLVVKCLGPCLVMLGITFMLLRILFTYKPTCLVKLERRRKKEKIRKCSENKCAEKDIVKTNQHSKRSQNRDKGGEGVVFSIETMPEEGMPLGYENIRDVRERQHGDKLNNEVVIKVSKHD